MLFCKKNKFKIKGLTKKMVGVYHIEYKIEYIILYSKIWRGNYE